MSGASLTGVRKAGREPFGDNEPRGPFGKRPVARGTGRDAALGFLPARSVDVEVPDLRRRIGKVDPGLPARYPLAISLAIIATLSVALWFGLFELGSFVLRLLPNIF